MQLELAARSRAPRILALCLSDLPRDPVAGQVALEALAEAMLVISPRVEVALPDTLLLDTSAAHLVCSRGGADGERVLAQRARALAAGLGHRCRAIVVASGRRPARALARHAASSLLHLTSDETADALAELPLAALELEPELEAPFRSLGIRSVGDLAQLLPEALAHRFGQAGVAAARLARGEDDSQLRPYVAEKLPEESLDLSGTEPGAIESVEPLLFAVKRLADRLSARMAGRGLGATRLEMALKLDSTYRDVGGRAPALQNDVRLGVSFARPSASAATWLLPLKEQVTALTLPGPVIGIRLAVTEAAKLLHEQLAIGDRPEVLTALEDVLARLAARLGDGAFFSAEPADRYRPEAAYRPKPFLKQAAGREKKSGGRKKQGPKLEQASACEPGPPRPARLLATPLALVAEGEGGRLTAIRFNGRAFSVQDFAGPERLRGEWWAEPFDRDYFRMRLDDLGDCWIYRNGQDGRLYLHGFFD
jgi:protein ImuB